MVLPLGLSFFTFKAVSWLADAAAGRIDVFDPVRTALYLSFFAQVQSGPLARYQDMIQTPVRGMAEPDGASGTGIRVCWSDFSQGACRFMTGFQKKVLLADVLSNITAETFAADPLQMSAAYAWLGAVCYSLQLFFDFSGYSDMAVGISRMFGFQCPENFNYPYMTESVSAFWRRWHMTLGAWFRDYVYIPLGGSRTKSKILLYRNLFVVWMLTGIWHGAGWNFIFWGFSYFVLIAFEKASGWPAGLKSGAGKLLYRISALFAVNFLWVIFRSEGLRTGMRYIWNMLGRTDCALADARTLFLLKDYGAFILAAVIFCFPVVPWINKKMEKLGRLGILWDFGSAAVSCLLFLWAVSMTASGLNNPFAYADF